jgi:hypothetical protein
MTDLPGFAFHQERVFAVAGLLPLKRQNSHPQHVLAPAMNTEIMFAARHETHPEFPAYPNSGVRFTGRARSAPVPMATTFICGHIYPPFRIKQY